MAAGQQYRAVFDYQSTGEGILSVKVGDRFTLVSKTDENWWSVRSASGEIGLAPISYLQACPVRNGGPAKSAVYTTIYDYTAQDSMQLSFSKGQTLFLVDKTDLAWWTMQTPDGKQGLVPVNYIDKLEVPPESEMIGAKGPLDTKGPLDASAPAAAAPSTVVNNHTSSSSSPLEGPADGLEGFKAALASIDSHISRIHQEAAKQEGVYSPGQRATLQQLIMHRQNFISDNSSLLSGSNHAPITTSSPSPEQGSPTKKNVTFHQSPVPKRRAPPPPLIPNGSPPKGNLKKLPSGKSDVKQSKEDVSRMSQDVLPRQLESMKLGRDDMRRFSSDDTNQGLGRSRAPKDNRYSLQVTLGGEVFSYDYSSTSGGTMQVLGGIQNYATLPRRVAPPPPKQQQQQQQQQGKAVERTLTTQPSAIHQSTLSLQDQQMYSLQRLQAFGGSRPPQAATTTTTAAAASSPSSFSSSPPQRRASGGISISAPHPISPEKYRIKTTVAQQQQQQQGSPTRQHSGSLSYTVANSAASSSSSSPHNSSSNAHRSSKDRGEIPTQVVATPSAAAPPPSSSSPPKDRRVTPPQATTPSQLTPPQTKQTPPSPTLPTSFPSSVGAELVEAVRSSAGITHKRAQLAVGCVLEFLKKTVPATEGMVGGLFASLEEAMHDGSFAIPESHSDLERLKELLFEITECKDDSQQRGWAVHDDEKAISDILEEILQILCDANPEVSKLAIMEDKYENVLTLITYYQMEPRVPIRLLLLKVFGVLCGLDRTVIGILLASVLPNELGRDIQQDMKEIQKALYSSTVCTMIFSTAEAVPLSVYDQWDVHYVMFLLDSIETPVEEDYEEQLPDAFLNMILSFNQHFPDPKTNLVMTALKQRPNPRNFSEKLMYLINRGEDPVAIAQPCCPDSITKFLLDLFSSSSTAGMFYTTDMRVLIDIVTRQLTDLCPGMRTRTHYLELLYRIVDTTDYQEHLHRQRDLIVCMNRIINEEEESGKEDRELVSKIWKAYPQIFEEVTDL